MKWTRTLFEKRKGRHLQASGSWQATKQEDLIIKAVSLFFTLSVIATLLASFLRISVLMVPAIICLVISFIGMFVVMFGIVYLKARKQPLEVHYYSDDYSYNGISGETVDNSREITAEEFYGKELPEDDPEKKQ